MHSYKLVSGVGDQNKHEGCWMSIGRWMVGEIGWTDQAACVAPTINSLCIRINDILGDEDRLRLIGPRLLDPFGTVADDETEQRRAFLCADRTVRVYAPYALRARGMDDEARALERLRPVVDKETAAAANAYANAAAAAASAVAAYAAYAATYAAAANAAAANAAAANVAATYAADAADAASAAVADAASAAAAAREAVERWLLPLMYDLIEMGQKAQPKVVNTCTLELAEQ